MGAAPDVELDAALSLFAGFIAHAEAAGLHAFGTPSPTERTSAPPDAAREAASAGERIP